jgi:hypothetical protein
VSPARRTRSKSGPRPRQGARFPALIAFTNNSNKAITASYQFSYTCVSATCTPAGRFYRTTVQNLNLPVLGSFVQDDFIDYLNTQGSFSPAPTRARSAPSS